MAILGTELTSTLSKGGETQNNLDTLRDSKLHDEYSINGNPNVENKPTPSLLDTDGQPLITSNLSGGEKLNKSTSGLDIDIEPIKYVDNKPT